MHYSLISEIPITETPQPQFLFISTVYHTFIQYQSPLATQTTLFPPLGRPRSERFKFLLLDKRKGAPVCSVKNFCVRQFAGPTLGHSNHTLPTWTPHRTDRFKFHKAKSQHMLH